MTTRPQTSAEYVYSELRLAILSERYALGERLDQNEIARSFNVSLIPVREGLRMLAAEGLVTITPHRGAYVTELSRDDLLEVYRIRMALEPLAVELAIPNMTERDLADAEEQQRRFAEAAMQNDHMLALTINQAFHAQLYAPARQPLLLELVGSLALRSTRYRQLYAFFSATGAARAIADHEAILAACRARNTEEAKQLVAEHLRHTVDSVLQALIEKSA